MRIKKENRIVGRELYFVVEDITDHGRYRATFLDKTIARLHPSTSLKTGDNSCPLSFHLTLIHTVRIARATPVFTTPTSKILIWFKPCNVSTIKVLT